MGFPVGCGEMQKHRAVDILIIGAGPTGLGAAWHLDQAKFDNWVIVEASSHAGGLASSFRDPKGFTWDIGGHVQFSHYEYFDKAMEAFLGADGWYHHQRSSWIWIRERFVPYPFQNNIHRLPPADLDKCLQGLVEITKSPRHKPNTFRDWIEVNFGTGIAEVFLVPYNFKVWAYPPELLNSAWVGDRVSSTDLGRVLHNLAFNKDDISWGPNNTFQFPKHGGTGAIWRACAALLPKGKLIFNREVTKIDLQRRVAHFSDNTTIQYGNLISTVPLTELIRLSDQTHLQDLALRSLLHSSINIVGLGLRGQPKPELATKCWMYFPEDNCPYFRATVFSNYSPNNVPDSSQNWSLMCEVSESPHRPVSQSTVLDEVIMGALNTGLVNQRADIVSSWSISSRVWLSDSEFRSRCGTSRDYSFL